MECNGKSKSKRWFGLAVLALLVAGCAFFTSKPTSPTQTATLEAIYSTAQSGCAAGAEKYPEEAAQLRTVLVEYVGPVVAVRAVKGIDPRVRGGVVDDIIATLKGWDKYLGTALEMAMNLIEGQGWVDTSSMYWNAVQKVVAGCLEGLNEVLVQVA